MRIHDILDTESCDLITARPHDGLAEASTVMARHRISSLAVVDDQGRLAGILSERDIAYALGHHGADLVNLVVGDLMTTKTITIRPDETVEDAIYVFKAGLFRHLVVAEDGKPLGIISMRDILKNIAPLLLDAKNRRDDEKLENFLRALHAA